MLNGYKAILGYVLSELIRMGLLDQYPMLVQAIQAFLANMNWTNLFFALTQILLGGGIAHQIYKRFTERR